MFARKPRCRVGCLPKHTASWLQPPSHFNAPSILLFLLLKVNSWRCCFGGSPTKPPSSLVLRNESREGTSNKRDCPTSRSTESGLSWLFSQTSIGCRRSYRLCDMHALYTDATLPRATRKAVGEEMRLRCVN
jgi:hypothetical protein